MNEKPVKCKKTDLKKFYSVLSKLTDSRFNFFVYRNPSLKDFRLEMYFCNELIASTNFDELHPNTAIDCLIYLVLYSEKLAQKPYFEMFGISFEIYHNKLSGKNYFAFRKNESEKWTKISHDLAKYILSCQALQINQLCDNVVSYCEYDTYHKINIKGE